MAITHQTSSSSVFFDKEAFWGIRQQIQQSQPCGDIAIDWYTSWLLQNRRAHIQAKAFVIFADSHPDLFYIFRPRMPTFPVCVTIPINFEGDDTRIVCH